MSLGDLFDEGTGEVLEHKCQKLKDPDRTVRYDSVPEVVADYRKEVERFMAGDDPTRFKPDHVWIARHRDRDVGRAVTEARSEPGQRAPWQEVGWDVLVVEPNGPSGPGQYELAVRMVGLDEGGRWSDGGPPGYIAGPFGLTPRNTDH